METIRKDRLHDDFLRRIKFENLYPESIKNIMPGKIFTIYYNFKQIGSPGSLIQVVSLTSPFLSSNGLDWLFEFRFKDSEKAPFEIWNAPAGLNRNHVQIRYFAKWDRIQDKWFYHNKGRNSKEANI